VALFELGVVVATPAALQVCEAANTAPSSLLARHQAGDWGSVSKEDAHENELSIRQGYRIVSSYPVGDDGERVWIITETDRSSTTILLPEEY
jgi:hypothetical protein